MHLLKKADVYEAAFVFSVENVKKNLNIKVEEACKIIGITFEEYEKAKADTE